MPALRDIQQSFAAALFADSARSFAEPRFEIYLNNVRVGFAKALAISFPVIERLMGEQYFAHIAEEFRLAHPSRSGDLHHIGAPFAGFLRNRFAGTQYDYFPDVAELEWAYQEALIAADDDPIEAGALRAVDASAYEHMRFTLHPSIRLIHSSYPIVDIWRANQPDAPDDEIIDLGTGGDHILVLRTDDGVEFHRLARADFATLKALAAGFPLGHALEAALETDPGFDLAKALHRFFRLNLFTVLRT